MEAFFFLAYYRIYKIWQIANKTEGSLFQSLNLREIFSALQICSSRIDENKHNSGIILTHVFSGFTAYLDLQVLAEVLPSLPLFPSLPFKATVHVLHFLNYYDTKSPALHFFFLKIFLVFDFLNWTIVPEGQEFCPTSTYFHNLFVYCMCVYIKFHSSIPLYKCNIKFLLNVITLSMYLLYVFITEILVNSVALV